MDGERFDALTRQLVGGTTRRAALRGLLATAGGLLGFGATADALAQQCREAGRLCNKNANCCSGLCDTDNPDPFKRKRCICPPGQEDCRGACKTPTDSQTDPNNCGGCGIHCSAPNTCVDGVCTTPPGACAAGVDFCEYLTTCNDPYSDVTCFCHTKLDGTTFCAEGFRGQCHRCYTDADCASVTGAGSACVVAPNGSKNCDCDEGTACVPPCPSYDVE